MNETAQNAVPGEAPAHVPDRTGSRWFFYETSTGDWQWDRVDASGAILARAARPFASRTDCVINAKSMGYAPERG